MILYAPKYYYLFITGILHQNLVRRSLVIGPCKLNEVAFLNKIIISRFVN
jgi:hypothetical protein